MKFFWLDSLREYDNAVEKGVSTLLDTLYAPLAQKFSMSFEYVDVAKTLLVSNKNAKLLYEGRDLLQEKAKVFISYSNVNIRIEKQLESIFKIAIDNPNWEIVNTIQEHPLLDKDKIESLSFFSCHDIPTLPSILIPGGNINRNLIEQIEQELGSYPYILKPKQLLAGMGIMKIESREMLISALDVIHCSTLDYIAQPLIQNAIDYRIYMNGSEIIACLRREPQKGNFLASISQSGKGKTTSLPEPIRSLSIKITEILDSKHYLCIDWITSGDDVFFLSEIEPGGGFSALDESEKLEAAKAFFRI